MDTRWRGPLALATLLALLAATPVGAASPTLTATASFEAGPDGPTCRLTTASLAAAETAGGGATVELTYAVLGGCGGAEGLFYYELSSGVVAVDPGDVTIHPGLRRASLDTTIPAFDEEGGVTMLVRVQATWQAAGSGGGPTRAAIASLDVSGPGLEAQYLTNPLATSVEAWLSRSRG